MVANEMALFMIRYDYLKILFDDAEYMKHKKNSQFFYFIIRLKAFERSKEYFEMTGDERFRIALECKLKGNQYLVENLKPKLALRRFKRAIDLLETSIDLDDKNSERDELLFKCYLNISKAYFDVETPELSSDYLDKALNMKPNNEKALYRYGLLLMKRKLFKDAKNNFQNLLTFYPTNKLAKKLLNECETKLLEQSNDERNLCKLMCKELI